jgi:hypothetical protein
MYTFLRTHTPDRQTFCSNWVQNLDRSWMVAHWSALLLTYPELQSHNLWELKLLVHLLRDYNCRRQNLELTCAVCVCTSGTLALTDTPAFSAIGAAVCFRHDLWVVFFDLRVGAEVVSVAEFVGGRGSCKNKI